MLEQLAQLLEQLPTILGALLTVVGGFAALATLTPNTSDDAIIAKILGVINFLAANFGNASNAPDEPPP